MTMTSRDPAAQHVRPCPSNEMHLALEMMERALALIDDHDGPSDAGAHLDLAVHRLRDWIEANPN